MRRLFATIAIIAFTCVLVLRLRVLLLGQPPVITWLWLAWHRIARTINAGRAPLLNCDVPEENLVRNSYSVVLRSGYSFEQHKQAMGPNVGLDTAAEKVLEYPFPGFQTTYFAKIEDPSWLDTIRADPGVELIECDVL